MRMSQQMGYEEIRNQEHTGSYAGGYKDPFMSGQKISLPPPTVSQDQSTPSAFRLALAICSLVLIGLVVLLSVIAIGFSHAQPIVIFTVLVILAMVCATTTLINLMFGRH
jgi:fatty acid desaturase